MKQKPKELEWEKQLKTFFTKFHTYEELEKLVSSLLTQQRTELEQQKVKVVWNDVCEQIKQEARTELLEEILEKKTDSANCFCDVVTISDITNLLNNKNETK